MSTFRWAGLPYIALVSLVAGLIWRYRYDRYGWTTRSSPPYESRLLNFASPLLHYGILFVFVGHLMVLLTPASWTDAVGLTEHAYHLLSLFGGTAAGVLAVAGIAILIYRRRTRDPVLRATTGNDKVMYLMLVSAILLGYGYRQTIAPWSRGIRTLRPDPALMEGVPVTYRIHAVAGMALIALVPFTRLVHMFSAPVRYRFRPYIVYRTRDPRVLGERRPRRGWEPIDRV